MSKKLRTIIVNDYMADDAIEEANFIVDYLNTFGIPADLKWRQSYVDEEVLSIPTDLMIIDYGGIMPGQDEMIRFQIRELCEWAENHPGKLLIIWTFFTALYYEGELEEEFGHLNNILIRTIDNDDKVFETIKKWYSISEKSEE